MLTAWRTHRERAGFDAHVSLRNLTRTRRVTPVPIHQIPVVARVARLLDAPTATHHTRTALAAQRLRAALGHAGRRAARIAVPASSPSQVLKPGSLAWSRHPPPVQDLPIEHAVVDSSEPRRVRVTTAVFA